MKLYSKGKEKTRSERDRGKEVVKKEKKRRGRRKMEREKRTESSGGRASPTRTLR